MQKFLLLALLIIGAVSVLVSPIHSQELDKNIQIEVEAGYDGYYKNREWLPLKIIASNQGSPIEGELQATIGASLSGQEITYAVPVNLGTNSSKQFKMVIPPPRFQQELTIYLAGEDGIILAQETSNQLSPIDDNTLLYGIASSTPEYFEFLEDVAANKGEAVVAFLDLNELPEDQIGLNSLDIFIIDDVDSSQLNNNQIAALKNWVGDGGQLVVNGGPNWPKSSAAFKADLPVNITGSKAIDALEELASWGPAPFQAPGPYLVSEGVLQDGELIVGEQGLPILARRPYGSGNYYFLALDPKLAPLANWEGQEMIWHEVAKSVPGQLPWDGGFQNDYYTSSAVTNIPNIQLPSFSLIAVLLLIYVIIIGPLNFLVLNRLGRRELAWITIPLGVLVFSGAAYLFGRQILGREMIIHHISLVTGHVDADQSRVRSVIGMYAPQQESFDLALPPNAAVRPAENFQGGKETSSMKIINADQAVEINDIQANTGDLFPFQIEDQTNTPDLRTDIQLSNEKDRLELQIEIENKSAIYFADAALLIGGQAIPLGDLPPGILYQRTELLGLLNQDGSQTPLIPPETNINSPLVANGEVLVGSLDMIEDAYFTRWEILQAVDGGSAGTQSSINTAGNDLFLVAWSGETHLKPPITPLLDGQTTTLYIYQLPLSGNQELIRQFLETGNSPSN